MVPLSAVLMLVFLLGVAVLLLAFGRWMAAESKSEAQLHSPNARTVRYVVPDGQDPTAVMSALARAGFSACVDMARGEEVLVIGCEPSDRETVRRIIESLQRSGGKGSEQPVVPVTFQDDSHTTGG